MKAVVKKSHVSGNIIVPGSKSHTIRAIAIACLAEGQSKIINPLISEDTISALNAAKALGVKVVEHDHYWLINGVNGNFNQPENIIDLGNSGTTLRLFSAMAATSNIAVTFDGDESLRSRPMQPLLSALEQLGAKVTSNNGRCPITITGPLSGGNVTVDGTTSQYTSALLISTPLLKEDSVIEIPKLNEVPYVDITLQWLKSQNIQYKAYNYYDKFEVEANQAYSAFTSHIPADFSTATFPLLAAAITQGDVVIENLDFSDAQGDKEVFNLFTEMGVKVERGTTNLISNIHGKYNTDPDNNSIAKLKALKIDLNSTPDALPAIAVAAACCNGTTIIHNVAQARIKETDRIACMAKELGKMGAKITETPDGMIIEGSDKLTGAIVNSYDDHRIAMALTIAGMVAEGETTILDCECAAVTYPNFFDDFIKIGADITLK
ncbi:3-phosphoshikimate 1-carboxyvinyltransferase [Lentisphaerota bacterium WC36G]|nr:3-phosphoshikimate 1-carboxyvinyltransferase [Lentisphaerae bacterium WC36]